MRPFWALLPAVATLFGATSVLSYATSVPGLSFAQLTDNSDLVVSGTVTRSWAAWDSSHKFIWTHYAISVSAASKGKPGGEIEIAEPGGEVAGEGMTVSGAVPYVQSEKVLLFLRRMPNGYLRTTAWAQGKYLVDAEGRVHPAANAGAASYSSTTENHAESRLAGLTVARAHALVAARVAAAHSSVRTQ